MYHTTILNPLYTTEIIILLPNIRVICFLRKYQLKIGNLHTADPVLVLYAHTLRRIWQLVAP